MSVPTGSGPFHTLDRNTRDQIMAHQAKVVAALSNHSDPALRRIGRLLASGVLTPRQLMDDPRRTARKPTGTSSGHTVARRAVRANEPGPASRSNYTDPDNGAGGVPAIRR
jgi:hypothetical protein